VYVCVRVCVYLHRGGLPKNEVEDRGGGEGIVLKERVACKDCVLDHLCVYVRVCVCVAARALLSTKDPLAKTVLLISDKLISNTLATN
jgi:hypothetical protein